MISSYQHLLKVLFTCVKDHFAVAYWSKYATQEELDF